MFNQVKRLINDNGLNVLIFGEGLGGLKRT